MRSIVLWRSSSDAKCRVSFSFLCSLILIGKIMLLSSMLPESSSVHPVKYGDSKLKCDCLKSFLYFWTSNFFLSCQRPNYASLIRISRAESVPFLVLTKQGLRSLGYCSWAADCLVSSWESHLLARSLSFCCKKVRFLLLMYFCRSECYMSRFFVFLELLIMRIVFIYNYNLDFN